MAAKYLLLLALFAAPLGAQQSLTGTIYLDGLEIPLPVGACILEQAPFLWDTPTPPAWHLLLGTGNLNVGVVRTAPGSIEVELPAIRCTFEIFKNGFEPS